MTAWTGQLADGVMTRGAAWLSTPRGSVGAWLRRPRGDDEQLRREVHLYLTFAVLDLTGR